MLRRWFKQDDTGANASRPAFTCSRCGREFAGSWVDYCPFCEPDRVPERHPIYEKQHWVRLHVDEAGTVFVDGVVVPMEDLEAKLQEIRTEVTIVAYSRHRPDEQLSVAAKRGTVAIECLTRSGIRFAMVQPDGP
jgi:hypothetical protein